MESAPVVDSVPLHGSSFDSFEDAALQAIASATQTGGGPPRWFDVERFSVEIGGFVGRPQYVVEVVESEIPDA